MTNSALSAFSGEDINYLKKLAWDTWQCLDFMQEPVTCLPYDNFKKNRYTSVSNIGIFFASQSGAYLMGYLEKKEAEDRLKKALESLQSIKRWHGFTQSWNSVKALQPSTEDTWISTLDSGNLVGGLLVAKSIFPELAARIETYINQIDWPWILNETGDLLYGGYITDKRRFANPLTLLGGDPRLICFLAIAYQAADTGLWNRLDRTFEKKYGQKYLMPGWQGGGLFMQYISGLFVNEWASFLNRSAANFAYVQILHALKNSYPVWGWSASDAPEGGYLGWGFIKDEVVTPHACVLALAHYPQQVIKNLKNLEKMGAREPYLCDGKRHEFGFRDAINIRTQKVTDNYLYLDQGMLFLSLVDFFHDNSLRNGPKSDTLIAHAREKLDDYHPLEPMSFKEILHQRDCFPEDGNTPFLSVDGCEIAEYEMKG